MHAWQVQSTLPSRRLRLAILVLGLILPQVILFGPSLVGQKILLPLDLLAYPRFYLPATPEYAWIEPGNQVFSDLILEYEMSRRFTTAELRAGRVPLWNPYGYTGAPFANFFKYSPFMWPYYAIGKPWTLAWIQLLVALVAGLGAYVFFRRVLSASYWPAAIGAWCYPLTGFFMLWQGFSLPYVTAWFPWLLFATDQAVRRPNGFGGPLLATLSCLVLISGQVDVAGQALLASGIYAVWCWFDHRRTNGWRPRRAIMVACVAWTIGILVATPYLLPLNEYARTGARFAARTSGDEERPPIGLSALPQFVLPDVYGSAREGSMYLAHGNQLEGPPAAYAGLLIAFLAMPMAWRSRRHRSITVLLASLSFLALSWDLDLPGFVQLLRLPVLNVMSHNRFVFVSGFSFVALAVIGLEVVRSASPLRRRWLPLLAAIPLAFGAWCLYRAFNLPEPLATGLEEALKKGEPMYRAVDLSSIHRYQERFSGEYLRGAVLSALSLLGLVVLSTRLAKQQIVQAMIGLCFLGELLWFAYGFHPQVDRRLYFPSIPVLEKLAAVGDERIVGVGCLPPNLNERFGFRDIRGYDGVDPIALVQLLEIARDPKVKHTNYAQTQNFAPLGRITETGEFAVSPVLSMLNVRFLLFRGSAPAVARTFLSGDDYWIGENLSVTPRPFIPKRVERASGAEALKKLADPGYDPLAVAYVAETLDLPDDARGRAEIVEETPMRIEIGFDMETPGLLVLSDLWDSGWRADLNGTRVPIVRTNHAVRGVAVPAGSGTLVFQYKPTSFFLGLALAVGSLAALLAWALGTWRRVRAEHNSG